MSVAPSSSRTPRPQRDPAYRRPDMTRLHARRREARRRRRLARVDVGIGVAAALFVIIVSPGLAVTGIVALLVLAGCGVSVLVGARRRRRATQLARGSVRGAGTARTGEPAAPHRASAATRRRSGLPL